MPQTVLLRPDLSPALKVYPRDAGRRSGASTDNNDAHERLWYEKRKAEGYNVSVLLTTAATTSVVSRSG